MKADQNGHGGGAPGGHANVNREVTRQQSLAANHEVSDVELRGIIVFLIGLTVMTVVIYLLMMLMFTLLNTREAAAEPKRPVLALTEKERLPPEPRLQSAPGFAEQLGKEVGVKETAAPFEKDQPKDRTWELDQLEQKWQEDLNQGPKDQSGKSVGISIDQAKQQLLSGNGLPARTVATPTAEAGPFSYAIELPTAASSGRMTEKRKQ